MRDIQPAGARFEQFQRKMLQRSDTWRTGIERPGTLPRQSDQLGK